MIPREVKMQVTQFGEEAQGQIVGERIKISADVQALYVAARSRYGLQVVQYVRTVRPP